MSRKMLVAYSTTSTHVQTTLDYLTAFKDHSGYDTAYLHVTHHAHIAMDFDAAGYDIILHNYCSRFCFDGYVSPSYSAALKRFSGLKVLAVQDEYDHTNKLKTAIKAHGFHIVLTCVPQDALEFVYPSAEFPGVKFITVFTGYVPEGFAEAHRASIPLRERPITVGYRGRDIGARYGRLGFEKFEIGRRMKEICDTHGVANDIAMTEESRIYGPAWFDFIGNCRSMLGSESGSNVFDFDGSVQEEYNRITKRLGRVPTVNEFSPAIAERDKQIDMGQISPRIFECAVMRTPMILFRGRYSDAITADVHYIPLELDFSNAADVLEKLENFEALEFMVDRTYGHLVASGLFSYRTYVQNIVREFERRIANLQRRPAIAEVLVAVVLEARQQILLEVPTSSPKGMDDYRAKQQAIANLDIFRARVAQVAVAASGDVQLFGQPDHVSEIDDVYFRLIKRYQGEVSDLSGLLDRLSSGYWIETEINKSDNVNNFRALFEIQVGNFIAKRSGYRQAREAFIEELKATCNSTDLELLNTKMLALTKLDQEWVSAYFVMFNEIRESRQASIHAFDAEANRQFALSPVLRGYYWANRAVISSRGSKLDLVRAVAGRIPGARRAWGFAQKVARIIPRAIQKK